MRHIITTVLGLLFLANLHAQNQFKIELNKAQLVQDEKNQQLEEYYLLDIDPCDLHERVLKNKADFNFHLKASPELDFEMVLQEISYVNPSYTYFDGVTRRKGSSVKSFIGYLKGQANSVVRVTIGEQGLYGSIINENDNYYFEPAYTFNTSDNSKTILYNQKDLIQNEGHTCLANGHVEQSTENMSYQRSSVTECVLIHMAVANDNEMYKKHGSNLEARNIALVGEYASYMTGEFDYNISFDIVEQFVPITEALDPFTNLPTAYIFTDFENWLDAGGFQSEYVMAELWVNKPMNFAQGTVESLQCDPTQETLHFVPDINIGFAPISVMAVHEIAHNLGVGHDAPFATTIMAPALSNTMTWSDASKVAINARIAETLTNSPDCFNVCNTNASPVRIEIPRYNITRQERMK